MDTERIEDAEPSVSGGASGQCTTCQICQYRRDARPGRIARGISSSRRMSLSRETVGI